MDRDLRNIALNLITQYGDEAQTIAILRAAEYAALMDSIEWSKWEKISILIETINEQPHDG
jgi:hypothetical protein